jgi:hypothetical protein
MNRSPECCSKSGHRRRNTPGTESPVLSLRFPSFPLSPAQPLRHFFGLISQ